MGKQTGKIVGWCLVIFVLTLSIGAGSTWWYMDQQAQADSLTITSLQSQLAAQVAAADPAHLILTEANDFDFTADLNAAGGVDTAVDDGSSVTLAIENDDSTDAATNVWITMWDPETSTGGVHADLEDTSLSYYITYNNVLTPMYLTTAGVGTYTSGVNIGTIPYGGSVSAMSLTANLGTASDDTFEDGTYATYVYVYQASAQDSTTASYNTILS